MSNLNRAVYEYIENNKVSHGFDSLMQINRALFALSETDRKNLLDTAKDRIIGKGKIKISPLIQQRNRSDSQVLAFFVGAVIFITTMYVTDCAPLGIAVGLAVGYLSHLRIYTEFNNQEVWARLGDRINQAVRAETLLVDSSKVPPLSLYARAGSFFVKKAQHPIEIAAIQSALAYSPKS